MLLQASKPYAPAREYSTIVLEPRLSLFRCLRGKKIETNVRITRRFCKRNWVALSLYVLFLNIFHEHITRLINLEYLYSVCSLTEGRASGFLPGTAHMRTRNGGMDERIWPNTRHCFPLHVLVSTPPLLTCTIARITPSLVKFVRETKSK